jgi:hypothetical protein
MSESTNAQFAQDDLIFNTACQIAGVPPTKRQASKFRRDEGLAFKKMRAFVGYEAKQQLTILNAKISLISEDEAELHNALLELDEDSDEYTAMAERRKNMGREIDRLTNEVVTINSQLEILRGGA